MSPGFRGVPNLEDERTRQYVRPPEEAYEFDSEEDREYHRYQAVNDVILERLIERITGRGEFGERLYDVDPGDQFFAGSLSSQYEYREALEADESYGDIATRVAPFTLGLQFKVPADVPDDAEVRLNPSLNVYYRRLPTYEEQQDFSGDVGFDPGISEDDVLTDAKETAEDDQSAESDEAEAATDEEDAEEFQARSSLNELRPVYERIELDVSPGTISGRELKDLARGGSGRVQFTDDEAINQAIETVQEDERRFRGPDAPDEVDWQDEDKVPDAALEDEAAYETFLSERFAEPLPPMWDFEVQITANRDEDDLIVTAKIVNAHGRDPETAVEPSPHEWRTTMFDVGLEASVPGYGIEPFESGEIAHEYHYDPNIEGHGLNCSVERVDEDAVRTITVPIYEQRKYRSRETLSAPFSEFRWGNFEGHLSEIAEEMEEAEGQYQAMRADVVAGKTEQAERKFDENLEAFRKERRRFEEGMHLLSEDVGHAREAFKYMNEAFDEMGEKYKEWRLFQIVYIVMGIPDIVAQAHPEKEVDDCLDEADVIYFPTGGGKTEAYLGLVTFAAFYDRLRGKHYGTTALTKFPLRLLSLQQLQRIADVFAQAELVRRREIPEGEEFSLGYYVGKSNTPNQLFSKDDQGHVTDNLSRVNEEESRYADKWLIVSECPFCSEESVELEGDYDQMRLVHRCKNEACDEGDLPVCVTDREIYRYAPTFVVSTIDKIAIVGLQRRLRTLFGRIKNRCEKHGYSGESGCLVDDYGFPDAYRCDGTHVEEVESVDPPSILIQDELHLLREEFGAFDSHYETFFQEWVSRVAEQDEDVTDDWTMKTVTATATIKGAPDQVHALYWQDANTYPSPGPRLKQSFYAYEDPHRLGRRLVGSIPHDMSRTYAMVEVLREYADVVQGYQRRPEDLLGELAKEEHRTTPHGDIVDLGFDDADNPEALVREVLEYYETEIAYNTQKVDSDRLERSVRSMINPWLDNKAEERDLLNSVVMTGETDFDTVRSVLNRLEADDPNEPVDMINATSMISHGVDVDSLNFIAFFGMPRQTAEYIQSYSRVGRDKTGTVFDVFNPIRVRDRSHYTRFERYHDFQDLLVEATPLERWAEFAVDCTLPGIFAAVVLQYYDFEVERSGATRVYLYDGFREAQRDGDIDKSDFLEFVKRSYTVAEDQGQSWAEERTIDLYEDKVESEFDDIWERCMDGKPQDGMEGWIANMIQRSEDDRGPMRSLRDIDEQINIDVDTGTAQVLNMLSGGR